MFGWLSEPATRDSRRKRCANDGVGGVERAQLLERDEAVEVGLARQVHQRHAAAAELAEDLVAADRLHDVRHSRLRRLPARLQSARHFPCGGLGVVSLQPASTATFSAHGRSRRRTKADRSEAVRPRSPHDLPAWPRGLPGAARRRRGGRRRRERARRMGGPGAVRGRPRDPRPRGAGRPGLHRRGRARRPARTCSCAPPTARRTRVLRAMQAGAIGFLRKDTLTPRGSPPRSRPRPAAPAS